VLDKACPVLLCSAVSSLGLRETQPRSPQSCKGRQGAADSSKEEAASQKDDGASLKEQLRYLSHSAPGSEGEGAGWSRREWGGGILSAEGTLAAGVGE